jgi:protein gp37
MSSASNIEWTDATWNPVRGCVKVSPGCAHCYAETFAERWRGVKGHPYEQGFDLRLVPEKLTEPFSWKKPRRVFVNSMSDLFQDGVPDEYIVRAFAVMESCPQHTFQVLTKRPERMRALLSHPHFPGYVRKFGYDWLGPKRYQERGPHWRNNVWLGVSVENQHFADERIPLLLQTPAAVRFISAEPLLDLIDITPWLTQPGACIYPRPGQPTRGLDWVIIGGESGPDARPFDIEWARSIVKQSQAAGVPVFVKQLGAHVRGSLKGCLVDRWEMPNGEWRQLPMIVTPGARSWVDETRARAIGGRLFNRKGGKPDQWPDDLRVREWPEGRV